MEEFIKMEAQRYPELVNYMGFTESIETQEEDEKMRDVSKSQPLFEDHLSFDEMVLGIREGRFFKGRINISRVNIDESTVMVEGLTDDILVLGAPNQNRALNGDIVCLQILQDKEWVRHFKQSDPINIVDKQEQLQALEDNDIVPEGAKSVIKALVDAEEEAH